MKAIGSRFLLLLLLGRKGPGRGGRTLNKTLVKQGVPDCARTRNRFNFNGLFRSSTPSRLVSVLRNYWDLGFPLRLSSLRKSHFWRALVSFLGALFLFCSSALAQKQADRPALLDPIQGEREARKLIEETLNQRPGDVPTNAVLKIRDASGNEHSVPVKMETFQTETNWTQIYQAMMENAIPGEKLIIIHTFGRPNRYFLCRPGSTNAVELTGNQTMVPFAGSDFWIADLGFEFLHWPKQRIVKKEMRYRRASAMLESINPRPAKDGYARVDSWLTTEPPHNPVLAHGYDASGTKFKVFTPEGVERVDGKYQLQAIEMRNLKTKTRSIIEFEWQDVSSEP